jgi:hypothetical protein
LVCTTLDDKQFCVTALHTSPGKYAVGCHCNFFSPEKDVDTTLHIQNFGEHLNEVAVDFKDANHMFIGDFNVAMSEPPFKLKSGNTNYVALIKESTSAIAKVATENDNIVANPHLLSAVKKAQVRRPKASTAQALLPPVPVSDDAPKPISPSDTDADAYRFSIQAHSNVKMLETRYFSDHYAIVVELDTASLLSKNTKTVTPTQHTPISLKRISEDEDVDEDE